MMNQRREIEARIGHAPGDDDIRALRQRLDDGRRAEIGVGGDDGRAIQCQRRAGLHVRQRLARRQQIAQPREQIVAGHSRDLQAMQPVALRRLAHDLRRASRVQPAAVGDERNLARVGQRQDALGDDLDVARVATVGVAHLVAPQNRQRQLGERLEADDIHMPALDHGQRACHVVAVEAFRRANTQHRVSTPEHGGIRRNRGRLRGLQSAAIVLRLFRAESALVGATPFSSCRAGCPPACR